MLKMHAKSKMFHNIPKYFTFYRITFDILHNIYFQETDRTDLGIKFHKH